jgi:trimethylamine-N-oxide reductase (cytochrome c)
MQGLGKPGVHQFTTVNPFASPAPNPDSVLIDMMAAFRPRATLLPLSKQMIPKTLVQKAITNPPITFWGNGAIFARAEDQFVKYTYPIPKEEGGTEIHMIWCDNPCLTTCWNHGNETIDALRNPKIECIVVQHPWLENDTLFADIILPVNTKFEEEDIGGDTGSMQYSLLFPELKCIEPLGESKTDYEIVCEIAKKLDMYDELTEGKSVEEWIKYGYEKSKVAHLVTWEELNEKGYYVVPARTDWEDDPAGMIAFYNDPKGNPLSTPTGKIEFYSEKLAKYFPDDEERPPSPKWIEKSQMHDERLSSKRAKKYPLLIISNHGRWRVHAQCDDITWCREAPTCKVKGWDGYLYEPLWMHPSDAAKRGIKNGDMVKIYNERGVVLGGALVWERIMPGVVSMDHGARVDYIIPGELDRGGAINLISPEGVTSKHCVGMATSGYLVEVERVSMAQMEEWRQQYPEAFEREYDPASGLRFNGWVEGGME